VEEKEWGRDRGGVFIETDVLGGLHRTPGYLGRRYLTQARAPTLEEH